jgi:aspartate/methionine/tyrosine aminotransferase
MILIINPNNPNGKTFSLEEMLEIRKICLDNPQIFIMSDEVYTLFMYDGNQQVCISSLPDMFERTVTVNSQGKEFSCTGWRMGTLTGPEYLVKPVGEFLNFQQGGANN